MWRWRWGWEASGRVTEKADAGENSLKALTIPPKDADLDFCFPTAVIFRVAGIFQQSLCPRGR